MNAVPARFSRREFVRLTSLAGLALAAQPAEAADPPAPLRAAIIGFTGGGDYGHGYDRIFTGLEGVDGADPASGEVRTYFATRNLNYINRLRRGVLRWTTP